MKHTIKEKQNNSRYCLICGTDNPLSLKTRFYETEKKEVVAIFTPQEEHQSYPGVLHGGMSSAILDETIGRAILNIKEGEQTWGVTAELTIRYKKPVPLGVELKVVGRITEDKGLLFVGTGEIILPNGDVAVTGKGKFIKRSISDIAEGFTNEEWFAVEDESPLKEIEL